MLNNFFSFFSEDIGIDLGTANVLVYVKGKGVVINEPSVIALNQKTGQVVAVGAEAKRMVGRTPAHISIIRPSYFARPRVVVGVPSGITEVERRAVRDAVLNAGAREVHLVEEPMAAAVGICMPVHEPVGNMILDIGGGTSDIAVVSLGGLVSSLNLRVAGDKFNEDIINYVRDEFKLLLGERTAEDLKIAVGSVSKLEAPMESVIRGRDLVSGLPREVIMTDADVREAMAKSVRAVAKGVKEVIELTPPELVSDIMHRGIVMVGGGAYLRGLDKLIENETKIPTRIAEDPMTAVVRGCGIILENLDNFRGVLLEREEDVSPQ
ncbi:MAG: rod shape-determining protein [Candidatus Niyogibacteria bacterium]|nr:rod shape-determining protein [Candidatus Niyogibacteria bacterium]